MANAVFRFIGYSLAVSTVGVFLMLATLVLLPEGRQPPGISLIPMSLSLILTFASPGIVAFWLARQSRKANAAQHAQDKIRRRFFERERLIDAVDEHRTALTRNLTRAVRKNDYGAVIEDNRYAAIMEFLASVDLDVEAIGVKEAVDVISEQLSFQEAEAREAGFDPSNLPFDGHAFESWVANALNAFGWEATVTVASGDQGIDVIAKRGGQKLGIQCKLYSSAIGNKAVQEAHAGKAFYGVDKVAVLSNADFTRSARELAAVTGVILCSHHDIPRLHEKVFSN